MCYSLNYSKIPLLRVVGVATAAVVVVPAEILLLAAAAVVLGDDEEVVTLAPEFVGVPAVVGGVAASTSLLLRINTSS
jgi:hypothetical protein